MRHLRKLAKPAAIFFALAMLLSMSFPLTGFSAEETASRLQPYLAEMAAESPDEIVRVIVQKADGTDLAEKFAERLGAEIYVDLPIINGFAAALKGEMLGLLASHASVQWVSYDAPMTFSGESEVASSNAVEQQDWLCDFFGIGCDPTPTPTPTDPPPDPTATPTDPPPDPTATPTDPPPTEPPPDPPEGDCWWNGDYSERRKITFDNSPIGTDLVNFPVLVKLSASNFNYAGTQNAGQDIRFVDAGATCDRLLGYEIEQWNESGDSYVWVNIPKIDAASTTDFIYVYYNNPAASDAQNPAAVWSETYAAVYHMNGDAQDSSGNNNHGTLQGSTPPSTTSGKIGDALHFGSGGFIDTDFQEYYGCDSFSFEAYWKADGFGQENYIVSNSMAADQFVSIGANGTAHFVNADPTDRDDFRDIWTATSNLNVGQWYYTVFQRTPSDIQCRATLEGYLDGYEIHAAEAIAGYIDLTSEYVIGHRDGFGNEYAFSGEIDEVRISYRSMLRSADYIEAQNLSMTNAFLSVGSKEVYDGSQPTQEPTPTPTDPPPDPTPTPTDPPPAGDPLPSENTYLETIRAVNTTGSGIYVAVIDSGVQYDNDFKSCPYWYCKDRIAAHISGVVGEEGLYMSSNNDTCATWQMGSCWYVTDQYGHGSHVAGIIAGGGNDSGGLFKGIAPAANVINFRVSDQNGMAHESGIVEALQFIMELRDVYGIDTKVVNISINSSVEASYNESPLNAALEILWFNGIVVVASAGNSGGLDYNTINAAPANDPYVITVGAVDEHGTADRSDDTIPAWSAHGVTMDGVVKPDVYAPGRHIISVLSSMSPWATEHPDRVYGNGEYFRMSGTSMAAPMVTGVIAHMLYTNSSLTPDQIKYFLMHDQQARISSNGQEGGYLDASEYGDEPEDWGVENQDNIPHLLLRKTAFMTMRRSAFMVMRRAALLAYYANEMCGVPVEQCDMSSVNWNSVDWNSVDWNSVDWNSVNWNSVNWNSVDWNSVNWNSVDWNSVNWNSVDWNSVNWNSVNWNSVNWNSGTWDTAVNWNSVNWNSVNWNSTFWGD